MNCLDSDQILALALAKENGPALAHVGACAAAPPSWRKLQRNWGGWRQR
jgi:hypothetical protein